VVHLVWCATERVSVAHEKLVRHRNRMPSIRLFLLLFVVARSRML
jgi:hypothetical protein